MVSSEDVENEGDSVGEVVAAAADVVFRYEIVEFV